MDKAERRGEKSPVDRVPMGGLTETASEQSEK